MGGAVDEECQDELAPGAEIAPVGFAPCGLVARLLYNRVQEHGEPAAIPQRHSTLHRTPPNVSRCIDGGSLYAAPASLARRTNVLWELEAAHE